MNSDKIGQTVHTNGSNSSTNSNDADSPTISAWTRIVNQIRTPPSKAVRALAVNSAKHPKSTIAAVVVFSLGIFVLGLFTNFSVDVDEDVLWTPKGSHPVNNMNWINNDSGFPLDPRTMLLLFHQDGDGNVLSKDFVREAFKALDTVRNLEDYDSVCSKGNDGACDIEGILKFWNNSLAVFDATVKSDQDVLDAISQDEFPDGSPVAIDAFVGNIVYDGDRIVGAQSFSVFVGLPEDENGSTTSEDFEEKALDAIFDFQEELEKDSPFRIETIADRSFPDEFERAIINDIPLVPIVFIIMGLFTSGIFFKKNRIESRSTLGFMAVVSILLSILSGYGLMFVCGVPFTSMTQILPFVFFGVGLDDTFIITGCYFRLDPKKSVVDRVAETIDEIGLSIFLTTLTSSLAFGLGCISSIPAVFWLCVYAVPTMIFILMWQITFFISCLTIDERRVAASKGDGIRKCIHCQNSVDAETPLTEAQESAVDRFMIRYAKVVLKPMVKVVVITAFLGLAIACAFSTSKLHQAFTFTDVLPGDSYITPFFDSLTDYTGSSSVVPSVYFRDIDQSDPQIRAQMETFVNELVKDVEAIANKQPDFCWFRDFDKFVAEEALSGESFSQQIRSFLAEDVYSQLYKDNIVLDENGVITASRCTITMDNVDLEDIKAQITALDQQLEVTERQPINKGQSEFKFFTYEQTYNIWGFYAASAQEIALTTIFSVVAVTVVTMLLVPHWTASLFVLPLISVLYIDLLGVMQWAGIRVNPVSYITLVMSIGLLVDFILHILLRFYEVPGNRHEKTVEMLRTMGSSILIGGITTFLGTLPLAFSSSDIFSTVFVAFLALVSLGATHGLILLPVILSMIGPEVHITLAADPQQSIKAVTISEPRKVQNDLVEVLGVVIDDDEETV